MRAEDIDLMLTRQEQIVPSSGFTASVMDTVMREATAPPPLPFPWKRALPGLCWCLAVCVSLFVMSPGSKDSLPQASAAPDLSKVLGGVGCIAAALMVSLLSVALSIRMARRL
jgi:hypothetical protein